jgi:hypothetical protein
VTEGQFAALICASVPPVRDKEGSVGVDFLSDPCGLVQEIKEHGNIDGAAIV